jgi:valyl-tRNA synthetase
MRKKTKPLFTPISSTAGILIDYFRFVLKGMDVEYQKHKRLQAIKIKRIQAKRERFLAHSKQIEKFIGKDIDFAFSKLGSTGYFGSMDFGIEVGQWKRYGLVVELWFKDGRCTSAKA